MIIIIINFIKKNKNKIIKLKKRSDKILNQSFFF